jgi:hypothetical protein
MKVDGEEMRADLRALVTEREEGILKCLKDYRRDLNDLE